MPEDTSLDKLRDEYDTTRLLAAVDAFDKIRSIVGGSHFEPPETREELMKLHAVASRVINEDEPLSDDPDENLTEMAWEIEAQVEDISEAADKILRALSDLVGLCPEDEFAEDEDEEDDKFEFSDPA